MSDVKRLNFTVSQFESVVPYASEHGQYVRFADYAKLEAEAQALREEVAALREAHDKEWRRAGIAEENLKAALRARVVVVPPLDHHDDKFAEGWNSCIDEIADLNGKVVSERLLRDLLKSAQKLSDRAAGFAVSGVEFIEIGDNNSAIVELEVTLDELRALLGVGKEDGHA